MMLDVETQDWLDRLGQRGPAQSPATIGEAWGAAWSAAGLHTVGGLAEPQAKAVDALRGAYRAATGADPRDEARARGIPIDFATPSEEASVVRMLSRGLPEDAQRRLAPHLDTDAVAQGIAARTERQAAEVEARTFGVSATGSLWLAGLARTMVDPATLAATGVVAAVTPAGVGVPAFLAREFAVNAGAAAMTHPVVTAEREKLGLQPTPFFQDVLEAGIGGAALGGLFRAGGWALRRAFGREGPLHELPAAARDALGALEPEDLELASRWSENRAVAEAGALRPDAAGVIEHGRALDDAAAALDRGEGASAALIDERPNAAALAEAVTRRAYELSPKVFARADALDNRIAAARAEIQRIAEQPEPTQILASRVAEVERALAEITGKRRSSPRAQALRDELSNLAEERGRIAAHHEGLLEDRLSILRMSIVDLQSERARIGPKVRAVRAHAAQTLGVAPEDLDAALRVAAARDELPKPPADAAVPQRDGQSGDAPIVAEAPRPERVQPRPERAAPPPPRAASERSQRMAEVAKERNAETNGFTRETFAVSPIEAPSQGARGARKGRSPASVAAVGSVAPARPLSDYSLAGARDERALLPQGDPAVEIVGRSAFGPIFTGFEGRWPEAVAHLSRIETGDASGVLTHPGVATPIDVVWGDPDPRKGFGLAKILAKHPEVLADLPERLARMRVESATPNRIRLVDGGDHAVIRLDYDGQAKTWLMTAYEEGRRAGGRTESPGDLEADSHSSSTSPHIEDMPPPVVVKRKRPVTRNNPTLFEALAGGGGLAPHSELAAIFDGNPFVPGFGRLVRRSGMSLDDALRHAKELGYLLDAGDFGEGELRLAVNDLLDKLAEEASGRRVYRLGHEPMDPGLAAEAERLKGAYEDADKALRSEKALARIIAEPQNARVVELARQAIAEDGLDMRDGWRQALARYERELQERLDQFEPLQQRRVDRYGAIKGWDLPYDPEDPPFDASDPRGWPPGDADPFDAGAASGERAGGARAGEGSSAGERAAGAGGRGRQAGEPHGGDARPLSEAGAEGKPQSLIPGVEPVTDRQRAEVAASEPMRGGAAPPPAGGLFDAGARAQGDLFGARGLRADAERALREAGDVELTLTDEKGNARVIRASDLLREADEDAAAARELEACVTAAADEEIPF